MDSNKYIGEIIFNAKNNDIILETSDGNKFIKHFLTKPERAMLVVVGSYTQQIFGRKDPNFKVVERGYAWFFSKKDEPQLIPVTENNPVFKPLFQSMGVILRGANTLEEFKSTLN